ncbi:MAG: hypothetical protein M1839_007796 [Geoglossum umbratile]|nr:MAG: hypothetical protein M1839_007796 [Geoglossum umbratile]
MPLRKVITRISERTARMPDDGGAQQYGRSQIALSAEVAAATLRLANSPRTPTSTPLNKQSPHSPPARETVDSLLTPPQWRLSHSTTAPSPLNPGSSSNSLYIRNSASTLSYGNEDKNEDFRGDSLWFPQRQSTPSSQRPSPPERPPGRLPGMRQSRQQRLSNIICPRNPMTLRELGQDYSRYPSHRKGNSLSDPLQSPWGSKEVGFVVKPWLSSTLDSPNPYGGWGRKDASSFSPFLDHWTSAPGGSSIFPDVGEKEPDDDMHNPSSSDDLDYKPKIKDLMNKESMLAIAGFLFMVTGLLGIFVVLPILTFTGVADWAKPSGSSSASDRLTGEVFPIMKNIRKGLIDPDTPQAAMTRKGVDGDTLHLVFSDEFNREGRTFYPGDDPYWTAPNIWYGATQDLEWYDPDAAITSGGTLNLRLDKFSNHNLNFRSGMLNSWNQICFSGGALEVSVSLAGPAGTPGLWPGVWTMGNLGRPGYLATTEGVWPYTYNSCDAGITPNQSSPDGLSYLPGQKLSACTCSGEDHPSPGRGRGAPEIDVLEASVDPTNRFGVVTQSYQVAPFDIWYRPDYGFLSIRDYNITQMNTYCGGPYQQAISGVTTLNQDWYDGKKYQKYAFEYTPGGEDGEIAWFVGNEMSYMMSGKSLGPNGNVGRRMVSKEPMSIVLNLGISNAWTWIDWDNLTFPTTMSIDYVRWYQKQGKFSVTCDPPDFPTTDYIANHPRAYNNPNLTKWDETGYGWPKNNITGSCS